MAIIYNTNSVKSGLILSVDAGNIRSYPGTGTTWTDLSTNAKNGTHVNTPTFVNSAFTYNGSTQYTSFSSVLGIRPGQDVTIEIVARGTGDVLSNERPQDLPVGWGQLTINANGTLQLFITSNSSPPYGYSLISTRLSTVTQFNHYMISASIPAASGTMTGTISINGNLENVSTGIVVSGAGANYTTIDIGRHRNFNYGTTYFNGSVALARVYNRLLTANEITQNYNAVRGRYGV